MWTSVTPPRPDLVSRELVLHYQPVVELATGRVVGAEALVRAIGPGGELIPAAEFVPEAERIGSILELGGWVVRQACLDLRSFRERDPEAWVSVNMSARQLNVGFRDFVRHQLSADGLPPAAMTLELTETWMIEDIRAAMARLTELHGLGVLLAADRFGEGYASLNYVRRFPIDSLKIPGSFVRGATDEGESSALVAAVVELTQIMMLTSWAAQIEREEEASALLSFGCQLGQGFLFGAPVPADEFLAALPASEGRRSA